MTELLSQVAATTAAVRLQGVTKSYRHFRLENINLEFGTGTVNGLVGPNGAGKSTTMRIMLGLIKPDRGSVEVLGMPISSRDARAKFDIGYFSEDIRPYKTETIGWHMRLVRSFYPSWEDEYADELLQRFGLNPEQKIKGLSQGQRVKTLLMLILARRPRLLILDEPTNGLDPVAKQEVLSELMQVVTDPTRTIIYSSHHTEDIETICDTITFIDRGRVLASQDRDRFLERWRRLRLRVPQAWTLPEGCGLSAEGSMGSLRVVTTDRCDEAVLGRVQQSGAIIEGLEELTLAEIFVAAVARGRKESST